MESLSKEEVVELSRTVMSPAFHSQLLGRVLADQEAAMLKVLDVLDRQDSHRLEAIDQLKALGQQLSRQVQAFCRVVEMGQAVFGPQRYAEKILDAQQEQAGEEPPLDLGRLSDNEVWNLVDIFHGVVMRARCPA